MEKFEIQWKTLQSAFKNLNLGKSGKIQRWEMKYFCDHWGFVMSDAQFAKIFQTFDVDNDGEISYQEFQKVFGAILNPPEGFYFRREVKSKYPNVMCSITGCAFKPVGYSSMCLMHTKQMRMKSMTILGTIKEKIGLQKWENFTGRLKAKAASQMNSERGTDGATVDFNFFTGLLASSPEYGVTLSELEKQTLLKTFGSKSEHRGITQLNIKAFLQVATHQAMTKAYKNIRYRLDDFQNMNEVDTAGYFGTNHRILENFTKQFIPLNDFNVVVKAIAQDNKMVKVM